MTDNIAEDLSHMLSLSIAENATLRAALAAAQAEIARLVRLLTPALTDVAVERARQINEEGWTAEHDDAHAGGEMVLAAAAYADHSVRFADAAKHGLNYATKATHPLWPWHREWWKPQNPRRDLVRAAALLVAEIERLDRSTLTGEAPDAG